MAVSAVKTKAWVKKSRAGAKKVKHVERKAHGGQALDPQEATTYRALSARANCLARDRPDIGFACKELCREFAAPTSASLGRLERVARYLQGCRRLVHFWPWAKPCNKVTIFTDTDFAGCKITRRSTSGGLVMMGDHCVKSWSSTQPTLTLSSGEAELIGLTKSISYGLSVRSLCADLGFKVTVEVESDATAAIGMASREARAK